MPKEESGRLFSKVAKFVRNPLKDWSELNATADSTLPDQAYSREMLKEMIEPHRSRWWLGCALSR